MESSYGEIVEGTPCRIPERTFQKPRRDFLIGSLRELLEKSQKESLKKFLKGLQKGLFGASRKEPFQDSKKIPVTPGRIPEVTFKEIMNEPQEESQKLTEETQKTWKIPEGTFKGILNIPRQESQKKLSKESEQELPGSPGTNFCRKQRIPGGIFFGGILTEIPGEIYRKNSRVNAKKTLKKEPVKEFLRKLLD